MITISECIHILSRRKMNVVANSDADVVTHQTREGYIEMGTVLTLEQFRLITSGLDLDLDDIYSEAGPLTELALRTAAETARRVPRDQYREIMVRLIRDIWLDGIMVGALYTQEVAKEDGTDSSSE